MRRFTARVLACALIAVFAGTVPAATQDKPAMPPGMTPEIMKMMDNAAQGEAARPPRRRDAGRRCIPAMGYHYVKPSQWPAGPIYGYYDGKPVFTEIMPRRKSSTRLESRRQAQAATRLQDRPRRHLVRACRTSRIHAAALRHPRVVRSARAAHDVLQEHVRQTAGVRLSGRRIRGDPRGACRNRRAVGDRLVLGVAQPRRSRAHEPRVRERGDDDAEEPAARPQEMQRRVRSTRSAAGSSRRAARRSRAGSSRRA